MTNLNEAMRGAFAAHEEARRSHQLDARRTVTAIRRRRVAYAAGTGSATAIAVGAIAFGAINAPRWVGLAPSSPTPSESCTASPYGLANPKAFGSLEYLGRSYIDTEAGVYLFVHADGTVEELSPGADGSFNATIDQEPVTVWLRDRMVVDVGASATPSPSATPVQTDGLVNSDWYRDSNGVQSTGFPGTWNSWAWNVEVPAGAPEGVDTAALSAALMWSMGAGGTSLHPQDLPSHATAEIVARGGGIDVSFPVGGDRLGPDPSSISDGTTALDLVVTLADGSTYTITAHHDAGASAPQACASPQSSAGPSPSANPSTSPTAGSTVELGAHDFAGPESEVFACGDALRPELEDALGWAVSVESGSAQIDWASGVQDIDLGDRGVEAVGAIDLREPSGPAADSQGWSHFSFDGDGDGDDEGKGAEFYARVVAVDDGVIVGYQVTPPQTSGPTYGHGTSTGLDGSVSVLSLIGHLGDTMEPCAGVEPAALDGARLVLLQGAGAIGGPYDFAWSDLDR